MSDFDKEAERERLREKYEQEQQEREATEKMSELLLQGATMTNAHCSECGDPIFRYDGQEFCASCERAINRDGDGTGADADTDARADDESADGERIEVTDPDETRVQFGSNEAVADTAESADSPTTEAADSEQTQPTQQPAQPEQSQSRQSATAQSQPPRQPSTEKQPQRTRQTTQSQQVPSVDPDQQGDVTTARESLVRTLTRFSQQAEATDDPQRAQEYLVAAREAAEALSALRR